MTPRDRRALLVGGALAAAAVLFLRVVPASLRAVGEWRDRVAARRELLTRVRAQIQDAAGLGDSAQAMERAIAALGDRVLSGRREADAAADLASRLNVAGARERVRVARSAGIPDTAKAGRLRRVTLQASLEGDTRGTLGVLERLEDEPGAITVGEARFTALDPTSAGTIPEIIASEVVIRGWYVAADSSRGSAP
jgi:hypothetical protein